MFPWVHIDDGSALVQVVAGCQAGGKLLPEAMMTKES